MKDVMNEFIDMPQKDYSGKKKKPKKIKVINIRKDKQVSGNKIGGAKASKTNKKRYGNDFYKVIGAKGGKNGHTGGFTDKELARRAGALGGSKSKRGRATKVIKEQDNEN